jgi:hypothetical protein
MITITNHHLIIAFHPLFYRKCDQYILPLEAKGDRGAAEIKNRNKSNNPFYSLFFCGTTLLQGTHPSPPCGQGGGKIVPA